MVIKEIAGATRDPWFESGNVFDIPGGSIHADSGSSVGLVLFIPERIERFQEPILARRGDLSGEQQTGARTRKLGSNGPPISVIGFGTWEAGGDDWGAFVTDAEMIRAIRTGIEAGINWIDTAEVYGRGKSEDLVGRAVRDCRDKVLLATKVAPKPRGMGFRRHEIEDACKASLKRLRTEWIDMYFLHWPDDTGVPVEESWEAMASLAQEGLVRFIGVSNFDPPLIERCLAIHHVDSLQPHFSMLHLENRQFIRWCSTVGIGVVVYGPLAYGLLTGAITSDTSFDPSDWRSGQRGEHYFRELFAPGKFERSLAVVSALRPLARQLGLTVAQLALAWTLHQPGVTAAIVGSRDAKHVSENVLAADVELDEAAKVYIEQCVLLGPDFSDQS